MLSSPVVSIIVPSYNKAGFIKDTIESVLKQTNQNFEIVLVDDNSSDETRSILREFNGNEKIKIHLNETNKGGNYCRNTGISMAKGKYIIFLDADDLMMENCIEQRLSFMEKNTDCDFAVFKMGTFYQQVGDRDKIWQTHSKIDHLQKFLSHELQWTISSPIYKKRFLDQTTGFNLKMRWLQDVEFHSRILLTQNPVYRIAEDSIPDIYYRVGLERNAHGYDRYIRNYVTGHLDYLTNVYPLLQNQNQHHLKALKFTILSCLFKITDSWKQKLVDKEIALKLTDEYLNSKQVREVLGNGDMIKIKVYLLVNKTVGFRIKGINRLIKTIF